MIKRYTLTEMGAIWSEESKFNNWLKIEVAACEAWAKLGKIPADAVETINARAQFDIQRINEIEAEVRHDVIAFLTNVCLLYTSPSPRDGLLSRMPSSA